MEYVDQDVVQRVWQRVKSPQLPVQTAQARPKGMEECILEEWQTGQRYIALQTLPEFRGNPLLKQLSDQKQQQLLCLKGIYRLSMNAGCRIPAVQPKSEPAAVLLRKCYGSLLRCCGFYASNTVNPEFRDAYNQLLEQNRQQLYAVLVFLGGLK